MSLRITPNTFADLASQCQVTLSVGPDLASSRFIRASRKRPGSLDLDAVLTMGPDHGPDIKLYLNAGPGTRTFLRQLVEDVEEALAWAEDAMCDHCEEDVREPGSRYCRECQAEAPLTSEHKLADDMERARDLQAERGAA